MKTFVLLRLVALLLLTSGLHQAVHAQASSPATYAVRVAALTSAERDAVVRDLTDNGSARLVFACVPAGVLVFEAAPQRTREAARASASSALQARTRPDRITELAMSLSEAEVACAEARNR